MLQNDCCARVKWGILLYSITQYSDWCKPNHCLEASARAKYNAYTDISDQDLHDLVCSNST